MAITSQQPFFPTCYGTDWTLGTIRMSSSVTTDTFGVVVEGIGPGQIGIDNNDIVFYEGNALGYLSLDKTLITLTPVDITDQGAALEALLEALTIQTEAGTLGAREVFITVETASGKELKPQVQFTEIIGSANPFNGDDFGSSSRPAAAYVNGQVAYYLVGDGQGTIAKYANQGTALNPSFVSDPPESYPGVYLTPAMADLNGDGYADLVTGESDGALRYYEGVTSFGVFSQVFGTANPLSALNGISAGYEVAPTFADLDGDGDFDALVGEAYGTLRYYENTGSAVAPVFVTVSNLADNPFNGVDVGGYASPTFADIDGDGDVDAIVGERNGNLNYFENIGTAIAPEFVQRFGAANPFDGVDVGSHSAPLFVDVDSDGDLDGVIGAGDGTLTFLRNDTPSPQPTFVERTGSENLFSAANLGSVVASSNIDAADPYLVDLDGDGDLDLVLANQFSNLDSLLLFFLNTGTANTPSFTFIESPPFGDFFDVPFDISIGFAFADIDADGDEDVLFSIGLYSNNQGSAVAPDLKISWTYFLDINVATVPHLT